MMTTIRRWVFAWAWCVATVLLTVACGATLPPITIDLARPPETAPAPPVEPVPVPEPAPPPAPVEEPALEPPALLADLEVVVLDAAAAPIAGAQVTVGDLTKRTDGGGFVHFAVRGSSPVNVLAADYHGRTVDLPPGRHRVHLERIPAPAPPPTQPSPPVTPTPPVELVACGPRAEPTAGRMDCLLQVQRVSPHWKACEAGSGVACHRYVREVARALAAGDPRWGLITKQPGQQQCTMDRCGGDVVGGYGEDVVAYLPDGAGRDQWWGADIVGGAGAPGATLQWPRPGDEPLPRREGNLWAPVP